MKNTIQSQAVTGSPDAAQFAAFQAFLAAQAAPVVPASIAGMVEQVAPNTALAMQARDSAVRAVQLLDDTVATEGDTNQIIGKGLSVCAENGTLPAFADAFIGELDSDKYTHLSKAYRGQLRSYMSFIASFGKALLEHLIIPKGRVGSGKYYSLQKLYKNLKALGKSTADAIPHWLEVNIQLLEELNGTLAHIAKNNDFDKSVAMKSIRESLIQTRDTLAELVEANRPRTAEEKAAIAAKKEADKVAKAAEAAKAKAKK